MELAPDLRTFAAIQRKRLDDLLCSGIPSDGHLEIKRVLHPGDSQDKRSDTAGYSRTYEVDQLLLDYQGIEGDRHRRTVRQAKRVFRIETVCLLIWKPMSNNKVSHQTCNSLRI